MHAPLLFFLVFLLIMLVLTVNPNCNGPLYFGSRDVIWKCYIYITTF